eukprot:gene2492-18155_t
MDLMLKMLELDENKVPSPKREDMVEMLMPAWRGMPNNFAYVFKKLFVTNALNGSEGHLVSYKLFALIGNEMHTFCKKLLKSPVPVNLLSVIKNLIPPKGIHRDFKGSELLDYVENNPHLLEDDENETNKTLDEGGSESDDDVETQRSSKILSLTNITEDPLINKDAKFLDALQLVLEENYPSVIFKPHLKKLKSAFYEARRNTKKRVKKTPLQTTPILTLLLKMKRRIHF